jgi:hypothetical protein
MTGQYYHVLDCPTYQEINQDLIDYVRKYTTIVVKDQEYQYCNFLDKFGHDTMHFIKSNPKLISWFESMNLMLRDMYFTLAWTNTSLEYPESSCAIHLDKPPVQWKLNWPIMNMEKTSVRFYHPKDPQVDVNTLVRRSGNPDSKDNDNYQLEYKDFFEVERHDFAKNQPIIMNGQVAHDVGFYEDPVFPRIGMQVMFFKEPTHLL